MDHDAGSSTAGGVAAVLLWQTPSTEDEWAVVLTMSCCCLAANDKATAQKQMTENQREVFAVRQTKTAVSWAEPAAAVYSNNQTSIYIRLQQLMGKI